jgi:hypothetical protein
MGYSPQLQKVLARIEGIPAAIRDELQPTLQQSAGELSGLMAHLAETSRDTGALIDSIAVTPPGRTTPAYSQPGGSRTASDLETIVTVGNSEVRYPHLVEYGTVNVVAQPFFWPAVRSLQKRINGRTNRAIRKIVKQWWSQ